MTPRSSDKAGDPFRRTLRFVFAQWRRQPTLALTIISCVVVLTLVELLIPLLAGKLIDVVADRLADRRTSLDAAIQIFVGLAGMGAAMVALRFGLFRGIVRFTLHMMKQVAEEAFWRVQRFSTDWHANNFAGSTVRKVSRGMWAFDQLNDTLMLALLPAISVLVLATISFGARWPVMGLVIGVGSSAYIVFASLMALRYVAPIAQLSNRWDTRLGGTLADAITCNPVVKAFGAEAREDLRLGRVLKRWQSRTRLTWNRAVLNGTVQQILLLTIRLSVVGGAIVLWWRGHASAGDIAYVLTTYGVINGYLHNIGDHVTNVQRAVNELEELVGFHDEPLGVEDRPGAVPLRVKEGRVAFEKVTFRYPGQVRSVYTDFSVTIATGERVGLVGHSGSGKTTFVKLVQRLYDLDAGRVLIDGQDIAGVTQTSLRQQIAIVQQEPVLFHRSLAENIAYARPDASLAAIQEAAKLAHAHDFIMRLPKGYDTLVGERGVKLSGGERQRVALARAFLANAPILILDEATSSLDSESEALIQLAMQKLMRGRTTLVIAHRLSTVRQLDRILVFDEGRIVEQGNHEALVARPDGLYRRLVERQMDGPAPALVA
ncbi:MAG TPA: ABC transporter ATP-binding protein [Vineibacter sp.]|nr:ABC transporter ATP-binding protein [Vineibacter sp.]